MWKYWSVAIIGLLETSSFLFSTRGDECDLCPSRSVRTNRGTACVLLHVLPSLLQYVSWTCSHSPVCCSCFSFSFPVCHRIPTFLWTVQLLFCTTSSLLHFVIGLTGLFGTRATHCPCQLKTGPVSSRHTHVSMVYTTLFTSSLMTVASRLFRMCGFFPSSTTSLPACKTFLIDIKGFTTFALLILMHRYTPSADLNGMVFSPKSLVFVALARSYYTREKISARMSCPAAPGSIVVLMFT